ncbi:hypothetical protein ACHAWF_006171, partial [Thalassiosira exigua]
TSLLDRHLSSGKGQSKEAIEDRYRFQLAFITCFYISVKIHEPVGLSAQELSAHLCRGYYNEKDAIAMECDVLFALEWRLLGPTPMGYVTNFLELLPELDPSATKYLLEKSPQYVDRATADFYFATLKPSVVGAGCLVSCLTEIDVLTSSERQSFWIKLSKMADLISIMRAQKKLLEGKSSQEENEATKAEITISLRADMPLQKISAPGGLPLCA